jgi:GNAT superfamily N-acetyltransferase
MCNTAPAPPTEPSATGELLAIYLDPGEVGKGIGAALMNQALDDMRARAYRGALLWVLEANVRARRFYEKGGWLADDTVRDEEIWGTPVREVRYRIALNDTAPRL